MRTARSSNRQGDLHQAPPPRTRHPTGTSTSPGTRQPPRTHTPVNILPWPKLRLRAVKIICGLIALLRLKTPDVCCFFFDLFHCRLRFRFMRTGPKVLCSALTPCFTLTPCFCLVEAYGYSISIWDNCFYNDTKWVASATEFCRDSKPCRYLSS